MKFRILVGIAWLVSVAVASSSAPRPPQEDSYVYQDDTSSVQGLLVLDVSFKLNINYDNLSADKTAMDELHTLLRKSLIRGIHTNTNISVSSTAVGSLELARVQITSTTRGSVVVAMSFLSPLGTTAAELDAVAVIVQQHPGIFLTGPFVDRYGNSTLMSASAQRRAPGTYLSGGAIAGIILAALFMMLVMAGIFSCSIIFVWCPSSGFDDTLPDACWADCIRIYLPKPWREPCGYAIMDATHWLCKPYIFIKEAVDKRREKHAGAKEPGPAKVASDKRLDLARNASHCSMHAAVYGNVETADDHDDWVLSTSVHARDGEQQER